MYVSALGKSCDCPVTRHAWKVLRLCLSAVRLAISGSDTRGIRCQRRMQLKRECRHHPIYSYFFFQRKTNVELELIMKVVLKVPVTQLDVAECENDGKSAPIRPAAYMYNVHRLYE